MARPRFTNIPTVGSGGIVTGAGALASNIGKAIAGAGLFSPNSQIAPPNASHASAAAVAKAPVNSQARIGNRITKGGQR